jgi:hypothetical protein
MFNRVMYCIYRLHFSTEGINQYHSP